MEGLREVTGTLDGFRYPEHIYLLNAAGKLSGYIKEGSSELIEFKKPLMFDKRGRKFKKVKV